MARLRALLFLTLAVASLTAPGAAAGSDDLEEFHVRWTVKQAEFPYEGRLDEGATRTFRFQVDQTNVTGIQFRLEWSEGEDSMRVSEPDRFALSVEAPDGSLVDGSPARGVGGRLVVTAREVNPVPTGSTVMAASMADARAKLDERALRGGIGKWHSEVTLESTGNPQGVRSDVGNPYRLIVLMTYYEASLMRVVSLETVGGDASGFADAWEAAPREWRWGALGLGFAATALAGLLVADGVRRRRARRGP